MLKKGDANFVLSWILVIIVLLMTLFTIFLVVSNFINDWGKVKIPPQEIALGRYITNNGIKAKSATCSNKKKDLCRIITDDGIKIFLKCPRRFCAVDIFHADHCSVIDVCSPSSSGLDKCVGPSYYPLGY